MGVPAILSRMHSLERVLRRLTAARMQPLTESSTAWGLRSHWLSLCNPCLLQEVGTPLEPPWNNAAVFFVASVQRTRCPCSLHVPFNVP